MTTHLHDLQAKDAERKRIERDIETFLAQGGSVLPAIPTPIGVGHRTTTFRDSVIADARKKPGKRKAGSTP